MDENKDGIRNSETENGAENSMGNEPENKNGGAQNDIEESAESSVADSAESGRRDIENGSADAEAESGNSFSDNIAEILSDTEKTEPENENKAQDDSSDIENAFPDDPGSTKKFDPVASKETADEFSKTRKFNPADENGEAGKDPKNRKQKTEGQKKAAKIGKATAKGAWFTVRKILTYALNILMTIIVVGIITGAIVGVAFVAYIKNYVDPDYTGLDNLKFDSSLSTTLYYVDKDGNEVLLEDDTLKSSENRLWADYEDIPKMLIDAYVAVEDMRFWEHNGVDMTRTASAIYNFFIPTSSSYGGGSTITQQLIKNVSGENEATIQRKVQEIFRAINVEKKYTKSEILEMYLNTIYLSHNSYGVRVAARTYFGKDLSELNLTECAAIASIGKWPTHYDPITNPENNLKRRNLVLKLMLEQEKISQEQFNEAYDKPIVLETESESEQAGETVHSYYIDAVMDDVIADLMEKYGYDQVTASRMLYSGGLQIVTCVDPAIQGCAEKVFEDSTYWPETKGIQAQSAMCVMDPHSGNLVAIVGGLGEKKTSRGLNRATQSKRSCGSSIKPISVYALAIENGLYNYGSPVDDVPPIYYEDTGTYWPYNANRKFKGLVSLDYAIQTSLNTVAVRTCELLGVENVYANLKKSGYTTLVDSAVSSSGAVLTDIGLSPLSLGSFTYGLTVREHTQAYATLANEGVTSKARTYSIVRDSKGKVILDNREQHEVQYQDSTAYITTDLLMNVVSGPHGTGRARIRFGKSRGIEVAGKTGTTNDSKDLYFSGYTPDLVGACWYGYDNNKAITASGGAAAMLWNSVFEEIYSYYDRNNIKYTKKFPVPPSVVTDVEYCTISGKLATDACRKDLCAMQGGLSCIGHGTFLKSDVPTEYCDVHVMCKWDKVTGGLCLDGCDCPEENLIDAGFRKMTLKDRMLYGNVKVEDAQYIYMDVPEGYIYPTDVNVPFFQGLLPDGVGFGYSVKERPANRICSEHYKGFHEPDPGDTSEPPVSDDPNVIPAN